jgi:sugar transferase (PEP-CTERM/EpsH1 system associated)
LRLLILAPQLPYPPHQGTSLRNFNLIAGLASRHRVHLLCFTTPEHTPSDMQPLQEICDAVHTVPQPVRTMRQRLWTTLTSPRPDMAHRLVSPAFQRLLAHALTNQAFDVIEIEGIEMTPHLRTIREHTQAMATPPRLVFDDHNAEYVLQKRVFESDVWRPRHALGAIYSFVQWQKLRQYEAWACRQVDAVAAVSDEDAAALQRIVRGLQVAVVPNGVDMAYYQAFSGGEGTLPPHSLVFTGKMDFRPNVDAVLWFAEHVLPLIRSRVPDAHFYVVGQRPHRRLEPLRAQPNVVITGRVPDTRPYIANAALCVVPLRSGGGTRLKVLEAMAMRRAIVSTTVGCDGFPVTSGREVILADEPGEFADRVVELLADDEKRSALGEAGFHFARQYDWSAIVPRMEAIYRVKREA